MGSSLLQAVAMLGGYFKNPALLDPSQVKDGEVSLTTTVKQILFGDERNGHLGVAEMCQALSDASGNDEDIPIIIYCDPENPGTPPSGTASWGFQIPEKMTKTKANNKTYEKMSGIIGKLNNEEPPDGTVPFKSNPPVSAIFVMSQVVSPATRGTGTEKGPGIDSGPMEIFFNAIPTVQWALAEPFLNIEIHTVRPGANGEGRLMGLSLLKFLEGASAEVTSAGDKMMAREGVEMVSAATGQPEKGTAAGMELFTSPQTLVPSNFGAYDRKLRAAPVIDRFRPLLSVEGFKVTLSGADKEWISVKQGVLSLILHDRSRLAEVAEFVSPGQLSRVTFMIEYGWSHPHGNDPNNPYGMFINSLRLREKYGILNTSISFDAVGQGKIDLTLYTGGQQEWGAAGAGIADGEGVKDFTKTAQEAKKLMEEAMKVLNTLPGEATGLVAEIKKEMKTKVFTDIAEIPTLKSEQADLVEELKKLKAQIDDVLGAGPGEPDDPGDELLKNVSKAMGDIVDAKEGTVEALNTIADAINKKMIMVGDRPLPQREQGQSYEEAKLVAAAEVAELQMQQRLGVGPSPDPFLNLIAQYEGKELEGALVNTPTISLAKLMLIFLAKPLASTGRFNEVQVVFHMANQNAAAMGKTVNHPKGRNLGELPISIKEFRKIYKAKVQNTLTSNLTCTDFLKMVRNSFIDAQSAPCYGFADLYTRKWDEGAKKWTSKQLAGSAKTKKGRRAHTTATAEALKAMVGDDVYKKGYTFKPIDLNFNTEVMSRSSTDGTNFKTDDILIITFSDNLAQPREAETQTLASMASHLLDPVTAEKETDGEQGDPPKDSDKTEGGDPATAGSIVDQELVASRVLKFIQFGMPVVRYGAEGSVLKTATLSTQKDEALTTIVLKRDKQAPSHLEPSGRGKSGVPLMVYPTKVQVVCMGCPLLQYGQQFFMDFNTGTSLDTIYRSMNFEHSIKAGLFESSFELHYTAEDSSWHSPKVLEAMKTAGEAGTTKK